jgi:macrolide transport system ATP-binding/permease protein
LFVRTLANLHSVNLGFNSDKILLFSLDAGRAGYGIQGKPLYLGLREQFLAVPGITGATMTSVPLVAGTSDMTGVSVPGIPKPPEGQRGPNTSDMEVGPSFFETMQIPILVGRALNERDVQSAQKAAVVNEVFAGKYFAGVNPIGRHFGFGGGKVDVEIVGVAKNARYHSLKQEIPPVTYLSFMQAPEKDSAQEMYFELRTAGDPLALANTVRQIVHQAAPLVPMARVTTQSRRIDATILQERIFAQLCSCFGALALIMACVGLYGTMAYAVARRTSEIGIRMALGAERRRIVWMVLSEVFALSAAGLVIGFAMVWETTAFLKSFLFGMKPNDPAVLATSIAVLIVAAIVAGYAPAWRASRIDPMTALRHE